jgi:hypothetical protein
MWCSVWVGSQKPLDLGKVAEQSETGEEAVDSLTEGPRELPRRREEEEVVDVR